jgi:alpha-1,6-mannosyltransferase
MSMRIEMQAEWVEARHEMAQHWPLGIPALGLGALLLAMRHAGAGIVTHLGEQGWLWTGMVAAFVTTAALLAWIPAPRTRAGMWSVLAAIALAGLALRAIMWGMPPFFSHDAYRYAWDAQLVAHGISPYAHIPTDPSLASLRDSMIWPNVNWRDAVTIYPPGAQLYFLLIHLVAPLSMGGIKAGMALADMASAALTGVILWQRNLDLRRVLLYWWCPLVVIEIAGNAHVDVVALAWTLGALALAHGKPDMRRALLAGFCLGMAALTKLYPILFLAALWPIVLPPATLPLPQRLRALVTAPQNSALLAATLGTVIAGYLVFLPIGLGAGGFLGTYFSQRFVDQGLLLRTISWVVVSVFHGSQHMLIVAEFAALALIAAGIFWWRVRPHPQPLSIAMASGASASAMPDRSDRVASFSPSPCSMERGSGGEAILALSVAWIALSPHQFPWYMVALVPLLALVSARGMQQVPHLALWGFVLAMPFTYIIFWPGQNAALFLPMMLIPAIVAALPLARRLPLFAVHVKE